MTLIEKIETLNWVDFLNKLKSILKELLGQDRPYKTLTANLAISGTSLWASRISLRLKSI